MKCYWPEKDQISQNGVRQYFEEDLDFLEDFAREISRQDVILRVTEDNALRKHIRNLCDAYVQVRIDFLKKWSPREGTHPPRPRRGRTDRKATARRRK